MNKPNDPVILAVDLGTSGMKVALVGVDGRVLDWESQPVQLLMTPDGGVEQSPEEWWNAFLSAGKRLLSREVVATGAVRGICCSTQGEGTIPIDRNGQALMNCILWMDTRGAGQLKKQFHGLVNVSGAGVMNVLRWVRLTGGMPSVSGKDPAAHMLLVKDRFPEIYARTDKFLNVLDYMNLRLCGRAAATADSIITSWVTDNRNPGNIHYDAGLVQASGIAPEKFPEIVPCTAVLGTIKQEVADQLGLARDVRLIAGAIDNTAAAIGAGAIEDYLPHLYIGTSSWITAHVPFKKTDIIDSLASLPCALPDRYLLTALQATAGGNLTFLRDKVLYNKDELLQEAQVPDIFKVLDQIAARVPAGANGVIYTPWIWGERAPVEDKTLRAGLYNISLNNSREDIIRAFLEGIALNTRWVFEPVKKFLGRRVDCIHIVGGGAQSDVWCQIFADVLKVQVKQTTEPIYANARGATWIGAVGLGEIGFQDIPKMIQFKHIYEPQPENLDVYEERFKVLVQIYRQMRGIYRRLNG